MHRSLFVLWLCYACGQPAKVERVEALVPIRGLGAGDTLTTIERVRSLEAALGFRRMIFFQDTAIRIDGCSVALALGPTYRTLLSPDARQLVSEPVSACSSTAEVRGFARTLVLRSITGGGRESLVSIAYRGGRSYFHKEDFKVRRASSRPDGLWAAIEMRVYDAVIAD